MQSRKQIPFPSSTTGKSRLEPYKILLSNFQSLLYRLPILDSVIGCHNTVQPHNLTRLYFFYHDQLIYTFVYMDTRSTLASHYNAMGLKYNTTIALCLPVKSQHAMESILCTMSRPLPCYSPAAELDSGLCRFIEDLIYRCYADGACVLF